jgi:hypothetical protein
MAYPRPYFQEENMSIDGTELALIGDLDDGERDLFGDAAETLLARTFIIRGVEKDDRLWDFAIRNIRLLEAWFACANISLKRDEGLGVIALRPSHEMRARLGKEDTCALLVARLLFEEKRTELTLARYPSVRTFDFAQRYRAITGDDIKKTRLSEILRKFAAWRLIDVPSEPTDPEGIIVLYPSLALTLDQAGIDEILAACGEEGQ